MHTNPYLYLIVLLLLNNPWKLRPLGDFLPVWEGTVGLNTFTQFSRFFSGHL